MVFLSSESVDGVENEYRMNRDTYTFTDNVIAEMLSRTQQQKVTETKLDDVFQYK